MRTYLIGYDLNRPRGINAYPDLIKMLQEGFTNWWHHLDSTWIIKTNLAAMDVLNKLRPLVDNNDELLVVRLQGEWASIGFNLEGTNWLKSEVTFE